MTGPFWTPPRWFVDGKTIRNTPGASPILWRSTAVGPIACTMVGDWGVTYGVSSETKDLFLWWECSVSAYRALSETDKKEIHLSVLKKAQGSKPGQPGRVVTDPKFVKSWPGLWEHLTATTYPGEGGERKTSTISIFLGSQGLTASLNDRDNARSCFASGSTLEKLLDALEAVCGAEETIWREDRQLTGSSARKR